MILIQDWSHLGSVSRVPWKFQGYPWNKISVPFKFYAYTDQNSRGLSKGNKYWGDFFCFRDNKQIPLILTLPHHLSPNEVTIQYEMFSSPIMMFKVFRAQPICQTRDCVWWTATNEQSSSRLVKNQDCLGFGNNVRDFPDDVTHSTDWYGDNWNRS